MILGVDHLALTTNDLDSTHRSLVSQGFECVFMERDVKNHSAKRLMLHDFQPVHDLALYRAESGVAIEVTRHGATCGPVQAPFDYERDVVTLHTEDVSCEQGFLKAALQFREKEAGLCLESPVPRWTCRLHLAQRAGGRAYTLDSPGYPCMAFLTNKLQDDLHASLDKGGTDAVGPFEVVVGGKELMVAMFRSPTGIIYELIEIQKQGKRHTKND